MAENLHVVEDDLTNEELHELAVTYYPGTNFLFEDSAIETARAGIYENLLDEHAELMKADDVVLLEKSELKDLKVETMREAVVTKKEAMIVPQEEQDDARKLLSKLKSAAKQEIQKSGRDSFHHSTNSSEKELCEWLLKSTNIRPINRTIDLANIAIKDIRGFLLIACRNLEPVNRRSLVRLQMQIDINLLQLIAIFDDLMEEVPELEIVEQKTRTLIHDHTGQIVLKKCFTEDVRQFARMEELMYKGRAPVKTTTRFTFQLKNAKHVQLVVSHRARTSRDPSKNKYVDLEHTVDAARRRVMFAEETNEEHEFEIPDEAKFLPLTDSVPGSDDLLLFIRSNC